MRRGKAENGLRHCSTGLGCYGCPYADGHKCTPDCQLNNARDALIVITEQREQIKKLKAKLERTLDKIWLGK